jgi:hypothetical protein
MWFYFGIVGISVGAMAVAINYQGLSMLYTYHHIKEKSVVRSLKKTVDTVLWMGYLVVYQKIAKNVHRVGKNEYDVDYMVGHRLYKIRVHTKNGPRGKQVLQVIDDADNDVTAAILPYMGPMEDWHGKQYTPAMLGHSSLTLNMASGKILVFEKNSPLVLS